MKSQVITSFVIYEKLFTKSLHKLPTKVAVNTRNNKYPNS